MNSRRDELDEILDDAGVPMSPVTQEEIDESARQIREALAGGDVG